jgi:hypothetical protein
MNKLEKHRQHRENSTTGDEVLMTKINSKPEVS